MMNSVIKEMYSRQFKVPLEDIKVESLSSCPREGGIEYEFRVTVYKGDSYKNYIFKCLNQEESKNS